MTTGTDVLNCMPFTTSARTAADDVKAVNFAIYKSWPYLKLEAYASVGLIVAGQTEYDLSALTPAPSREVGVAIAMIKIETDESPVVIKNVKQYYDNTLGYWTLVLGSDLVDGYADKTLYVRYQYPHPKIAAVGETVYVKPDIAGELAALFYHHLKGTSSTYDSAFNRAVAPELFRSDEIAKRDYTAQLPVLVPIVGKDRI